MTYTPVAQRKQEKKHSGYVGVASRKKEAGKEKKNLAFADLNLDIFGTQSSTPSAIINTPKATATSPRPGTMFDHPIGPEPKPRDIASVPTKLEQGSEQKRSPLEQAIRFLPSFAQDVLLGTTKEFERRTGRLPETLQEQMATSGILQDNFLIPFLTRSPVIKARLMEERLKKDGIEPNRAFAIAQVETAPVSYLENIKAKQKLQLTKEEQSSLNKRRLAQGVGNFLDVLSFPAFGAFTTAKKPLLQVLKNLDNASDIKVVLRELGVAEDLLDSYALRFSKTKDEKILQKGIDALGEIMQNTKDIEQQGDFITEKLREVAKGKFKLSGRNLELVSEAEELANKSKRAGGLTTQETSRGREVLRLMGEDISEGVQKLPSVKVPITAAKERAVKIPLTFELNQSIGIPSSASGVRSFFDISSPETSAGLRAVVFQTGGSLSRISTIASDPVAALKIDPADLKYLNVDRFSAIVPTLYQKAAQNAIELGNTLKNAGFTEASIGVKEVDSFAAKVIKKSKLGEDYLANPNDLVRSTVLVKDKADAISRFQKLQESGLVKKFDNYFENPKNGYKAINADIRLPDGSIAEVQVHTKESLQWAEKYHEAYKSITAGISAKTESVTKQAEAIRADYLKKNLPTNKAGVIALAKKDELAVRTKANELYEQALRTFKKSPGEVAGVFTGIETDEEGNVTGFDPKMAALGVFGLGIGRRIPSIRYADLDDVARAIRRSDITKQEIWEAREFIVFSEQALRDSHAKELMKYVSKSTGRLPEVTGKPTMRSLNTGKIVKNSEFGRRGDQIVTELGFIDEDEAQIALDGYIKAREQVKVIRADLKPKLEERSLVLKGEELMRKARKDRRSAIESLKEFYTLNDSELAHIRKGRDLSIMTADDFDIFMRQANVMGEQMQAHRQARIHLEGTIHALELRKWENVRDVMKFPKALDKMTTEQLTKLETVLSQYKKADEFLPMRMMETLPNTRLKEVRTVREVLEILAKEKGLTTEQVALIKPSEFHRFMGDNTLAQQHPFYERMVLMKNKSFLEAEARTIELTDKANDLIIHARKSKQRGITERLIPTDQNIVKWLELDAAGRQTLAKEMTGEELGAAQYMDGVFREYYNYLVQKNATKKFSRFEDKYFPHVRRSLLEAWKEDGVLSAFKELFSKFKQDEKYLNILNEKTREILPYEKWIGFAQYRSDNLIPTANAARAFNAYVTTLEKAKHLDAMVPEMMAYVHALSPRRLTSHGLELDDSLKRFVMEWVNANKGRTPKGFFEPGGKMDWGLRTSVALTRFLDLALNFTTQFAAPIGEQVMDITMLKPKAYSVAIGRRTTAQGRAIINKYENFVGHSFWKELSRASNNASDNLMSSFFMFYHSAIRKGNELFLLGKLTDEEFKTGVITTERLAQLQTEMGKYRVVKGAESIMGRTGEAIAFKQYKTWATPIITATAKNAKDLAKLIREKGVKAGLQSDAGKELFYSIGIGSAIGIGAYGYFTELGEKKDRTFIEDAQYKAMRDALSMIGALDPTLWSSVRVADFYDDLAQAMLDTVTVKRLKTTGELKGPRDLQRTLTPRAIRQFEGEEVKETKTNQLKTPAGLPKLPSVKLPTPPGLPKIPSP